MHRGVWQKAAKGSFETRGKKLGIIGYGNIGSQLSVLAEAMGMEVYLYDVVTKLPLGNAKQVSSLTELLSLCDVISLHVPETPDTRNLIGPKELAAMKDSGILINASRGTVVDIEALAQALADKAIAGAAIDVYPLNPNPMTRSFCHRCENLITASYAPRRRQHHGSAGKHRN